MENLEHLYVLQDYYGRLNPKYLNQALDKYMGHCNYSHDILIRVLAGFIDDIAEMEIQTNKPVRNINYDMAVLNSWWTGTDFTKRKKITKYADSLKMCDYNLLLNQSCWDDPNYE